MYKRIYSKSLTQLTNAESCGEVLVKMLYVVPSVEVVVDKDLPVALDLMVEIPCCYFKLLQTFLHNFQNQYQADIISSKMLFETTESPPGNTTRFIHFNSGEKRSFVGRSDTALVRLSVNEIHSEYFKCYVVSLHPKANFVKLVAVFGQ